LSTAEFSVYFDVIEAYKFTNYDWDCKQRAVQHRRVAAYLSKYENYPCIDLGHDEESDPRQRKYVLMTTVAQPAFKRGGQSARCMMNI
jgi:hypothetical protein